MPRLAAVVISLLVLSGALAFPRADAAVFVLRVGAGEECDFHTSVNPDALQRAIYAVPEGAPPEDTYVIRVARNGHYASAPRMLIFNRNVTIEGGYETCSSPSPGSENTVIDGTSLSGTERLVMINGGVTRRDVRLSRLTLRNSPTGALNVRGADVWLERVTITGNSAANGAGIHITGQVPGATLQMVGGSSVLNNTVTTFGGGIHCEQRAALFLDSTAAVVGNTAAGSGGGIHLLGCDALINSGGPGLIGVLVNISGNHASTGGGIAVSSSGTSNPSSVRIGASLSGSGPRPLIINNTASGAGGGILARGQHVQISLYDAIVAGNSVSAPGGFGGGILATEGARVTMERTHPHCSSGHCSRISGNTAAWGGGVAANDGADVIVAGTWIAGNTATQGGSAYLAVRQDAALRSANNVIVGNNGASVVAVSPTSFTSPRRATVSFLGDTIADNLDATSVVAANAEGLVSFGRTIVSATTTVPVATCTACTTQVAMHCNVFHSQTHVEHRDALTTISAIPGFVNAAGDNYRLTADAWAIDRCPEQSGYLDYDHELSPRPHDSPLFNVGGPFDVGAYEWNPILFRDGFEG